MRFQASVTIAASRERVFAYLDDPELAKKWIAALQGVTFDKPGIPRAVGTRFRVLLQAGPGSQDFKGEVVAYRPPGEFGVRLQTDRVTYEVSYRLADAPGGTQVEQTTFVETRGWPVHLLAGAMGWLLRRLQGNALGRLRAVVERASGSAAHSPSLP